MNYEQKYKEALERARYLKENADSVGALDVSAGFEYIFHELRESEDEKIRNEIIDYLKSFVPHHDYDLVVKSKVWIAWLEKQGEQKPTKWSEEDEKMLDSIIDCLDSLIFIDSDQINWLKSIKPNHWKPTENQISKLLAVIHDGNNANSESCHNVLQSLYNDLKKL